MGLRVGLLLAGSVLALAAKAGAGEVSPTIPDAPASEERGLILAADMDDSGDAWTWKSHFIFWVMGIDGDVGIGDRTAEVDASFDDVSEDLSFALNPSFELRKGDIGILFDGMWAQWEKDVDFPALGAEGGLTIDAIIVDPAIAWRFLGSEPGSSVKVDAMLGVRWTYLEVELDIDGGQTRDRTRDWFDPYVGARVIWALSDQFSVSGRGTFGGFDVGSETAWTAEAKLEYKFTDSIAAVIGYRALAYDYEEDDFLFDVTMHGPIVGLSFQW